MKNTPQHNSVEFEKFYSDSIPTIRKIGYIAQVISGASAGFAIYSMAYPKASIWGSIPAVLISTALMFLIVFMFEGGLRKFLPVAVKQVIHANWNSRWWIAMFIPIVMISLFFLFGSGLLSWKAAPEMVEFATPEYRPESETSILIHFDSIRNQDESVFESDKVEIESLISDEIRAIKNLYKGRIKQKKQKAASVKADYPGWSAGLLQKAKEIESEMNQQLAEAKSRKTTMIAAIKEKKAAALLLHNSQKERALQAVHNRNARNENKFESSIGLWAGLGKWFCVICSLIALLCISIEEIYERGKLPGVTQKGPVLIPASASGSNPRNAPIQADKPIIKSESPKQESDKRPLLIMAGVTIHGDKAIITGLNKSEPMTVTDMKQRRGGVKSKIKSGDGRPETNELRLQQLSKAINHIESC